MSERDARPGSSKKVRVLVACQRCKSRRQKCDNANPACSNCCRARVSCEYSDNAYPSSYVKALEDRVNQLEARIRSSEEEPVAMSGRRSEQRDHYEEFAPQTPSGENSAARREGRLALGLGILSASATAEPHYFGFSAGLSLAHFIQVAIESGNSSSEVSLPLLADRPFSNRALSDKTSLATLPPFKTGARYIRSYLSSVHPLYPFLNPGLVWRLHESLTKSQADDDSTPSEIDLAVIHLVYAIGSRCLQLLGKSKVSRNVPEGHFLKAMKIVNEEMKFTSVQSIEVTLLLAIHSMRSPSGTSVWHLSGLAIRQCLELGLHKQRPVDSQNAISDQHRKRLFWSAYIFERKTALVLGRPFALSDEEIDLDLPMSVDEDENEKSRILSALADPSRRPQTRTSLSYHRAHVELYQIHTQIRLALYYMKKSQAKEDVQKRIASLFDQLERWRIDVLEVFERPTGGEVRVSRSRYEKSAGLLDENDSDSSGSDLDCPRSVEIEKSELLLEYYKARRSILQPLMTEGHDNFHFDIADFTACADASGQICQLYRRLHRLFPIPFSLRDLHAVFVAGFTLMYCICTCPAIYSTQRATDVGACSTVLYVITEQWHSAKKYRDAFEVVVEKMMESVQRLQEDSRSNRHTTRADRSAHRRPRGDHSSSNRRQSRSARPHVSETHEEPNEGTSATKQASSSTMIATPVDSQPSPYDSGVLYTEHDTDGDMRGSSSWAGLEIDLDPAMIDLEGLLSNEGLDWFTGAVL